MRNLCCLIIYRYNFPRNISLSKLFTQATWKEYHGLSATMRLAKRYKGAAVLWEHRFYGDSMPFPVNVSKKISTLFGAEGEKNC